MRWIVLLALLAGCDKKKTEPEVTAPSATAPNTATEARTGQRAPGGYVPVPETDLVVKLPEGIDAKPMDGIAGFETADKSFKFSVRRLGASEPKTVDEMKGKLTHTLKDVLHEEATSDGYILTFTIPKLDTVQEPDGRVHSQEVGVEYSLQMRFAVEGTAYKCAAILPKQELLQQVIDTCKTIKKKS